MRSLDQILVILWIGVAVLLFRAMSRPAAVLTFVLLGHLFLPEIQSSPVRQDVVPPIRIPLLEFSKTNSISYGLLLAILLMDLHRLQRLRLRIFDLPAIVLSVYPAISNLLNARSGGDSIGSVRIIEEAFAVFRSSFLTWGVPYLAGRIYLSDELGCRRTTTAIAIGGLIYAPFCLYEVRMSPVLHDTIYGFQQHDFIQTMRSGGFRPMVFMQHGIAVSFWMVTAALCLFWLWWSKAWPPPRLPAFLRRNQFLSVIVMAVTVVFCRSFGALVLGAAGVAILILGKLRFRLVFAMILLIPPLYVAGRATGVINRTEVGHWLANYVQPERRKSLDYRLMCEDRLMTALAKNPIVGMGGNPRTRPLDDDSNLVVTDALWIIQYFDSGVIGLVALIAFFVIPAARFLVSHSSGLWDRSEIAPAAVGAVVLALFMCDCLFNAMINPMYLMLVAALNGWNNWVKSSRRSLASAGSLYRSPPTAALSRTM